MPQEMERHIKTIESLDPPFSVNEVPEAFNRTGDITFFLSFKSIITSKEFNILLSKTGKLLARIKNEQLFDELAKNCHHEDFQILCDAYFSTLSRTSNLSPNPIACPTNFYNGLMMCHTYPLEGMQVRGEKRKRKVELSAMEDEGEGKEEFLPMKDKGEGKIPEETGKGELKRPRIEPALNFKDQDNT